MGADYHSGVNDVKRPITKVNHDGDVLPAMNETRGERLARLRKARGLTQQELADACGVGQSAIGNIERDTRGYGASVVAIARELGVTPEYLQGEAGESSQTSPASGVAQNLNLAPFTVPPSTTMEELQRMNDIPAMFQLEVPDDALAPKVTRGMRLIMAAGQTARPDQVVLVRDRSGALYLRRFGQAPGGDWRARATNEAYLSLEAVRDGLEMLATLQWVGGESY